MDRYFPIKTNTACPLKWSWTTLYLNTGITRSCHRTGESILTEDNFHEFHNTPKKITERKRMLNGLWPEDSCQYCKTIEDSGGVSDRLRHMSIPNMYPAELDNDPTLVQVDPVILEVYFSNVCNMGCLYCTPSLSSQIQQENRKFGPFSFQGVEIHDRTPNHYRDLVPHFWSWFDKNFHSLRRLHVLGGEPLIQKETVVLLDKIKANPNPNCELNFVTNLMIDDEKFDRLIEQFKILVSTKSIARIDITCSIDCWGDEQEYVRHGLDLLQWEKNFQKLLQHDFLVLNINQTISSLTIKTMPTLMEKLSQWRLIKPVGHWFSAVPFKETSYLRADIFKSDLFKQDFNNVIRLMPVDTQENIMTRQYMEGIAKSIENAPANIDSMKKLLVYLNEKDRRRSNNWQKVFPWLKKEFNECGIVV